MMRRNVELEARLIDDLLDLTRISQGKLPLHPQPLDVHAVMRHRWWTSAGDINSKGSHVALDLKAAPRFARRSGALQQVFWNLFKNALKFTSRRRRSVTIQHRRTTRAARVSVSDTGIGIEADLLQRIFNAFEQGSLLGDHRFGGLGLGLSISKAIVDLHGGELRAESDGPGRGATFTLKLDTTDAPAACETRSAEETKTRPSLRLLLVEDHEADARW